MVVDRAWTRFETWLALVAFAVEAFSMTLWVCLKGFSAPGTHASAVVFRALLGSVVLGVATYWGFRKRSIELRRWATVGAVLLGVVTAKAWVRFGGDYCSNLLNWYQQASFLTLLGGLRGIGTRLTMLLALLGGSLATARGRHIAIDVVTRFVSPRKRTVMVLTGWLFASMVCLACAWGFFDHISIENFGARADDAVGRKLQRVAAQLEEDFFIARKQLALDMKSTPHVFFGGETYAEWLTGREWNAWVESAGFGERYGKEALEGLKIPENDTRAPLVVIPGRGEPRGELINAAYLVFPIGLLIIAVRFAVRALLVIGGHVNASSDESEDFTERGEGHTRKEAA
jgi:TRAP-type C4-dicarboxylate transport system permease small subunit